MRFYVSTLDNLDSEVPKVAKYTQDSYESLNKGPKVPHKFHEELIKFNSSSSLSDSGNSEESKEDKMANGQQTRHYMAAERRQQNFQVKKKTELCKTYQIGLVCPYGNKCSFAHGIEELRSKLMVPKNFKTVNCKQFFEKDHCHFGPRCQFLHRTAAPVSMFIPSLNHSQHYEILSHEFEKKVDELSQIFDSNNNTGRTSLNLQHSRPRRLQAFEKYSNY